MPGVQEHTCELQSHDNLVCLEFRRVLLDRKSTRLNSSHTIISYAVFCLKKNKLAGVRVATPDGGPELWRAASPPGGGLRLGSDAADPGVGGVVARAVFPRLGFFDLRGAPGAGHDVLPEDLDR